MASRGIVYTFYSFKGGTGRSMALANVAALLARKGKNVLIVDWDLEAPGLEKYFLSVRRSLASERKTTPGLIDMVKGFLANEPVDWRDCLLQARPFPEGKSVSIISAGQDTTEFVPAVQSINWETLFDSHGFGNYLEKLREEWLAEFDFILIDSRTGITDIGSICTIHLPDVLVLLFTANDQSVNGVTDVMNRVRTRYSALPLDRGKLLGLPVPSRFENFTEYQLAIEWKRRFAQRLAPIYGEWLPDKTTAGDILEKLFIPYVPYWSFGEGLPVVKEGTTDPRSLGFAYDLLARVIESRLQWNEVMQGDSTLQWGDRSPEAINEEVDRLFRSLPLSTADTARQVLLRLIRAGRPGETEDAIRRLGESEFDALEREVIEKLIEQRLLHRSKDTLTKEPTIEISSESLIKNWSRLRKWLDEDREFLLWRQELDSKMLEWESDDFDKSLLLAGTFLSKADRIGDAHSADLNDREKHFIRTSIHERDRRRYQQTRRALMTYVPYVVTAFVIVGSIVFGYQERMAQQKQAEVQYGRLQELLTSQDNAMKQVNDLNQKLNELQDQNRILLKQLTDVQLRRGVLR